MRIQILIMALYVPIIILVSVLAIMLLSGCEDKAWPLDRPGSYRLD